MLEIGQILDNKYEVQKLIGEGGMSRVYLSKNTRLDYMCAIKEIKNELNDSYEFKCEVDILKNLNHKGIPRILDFFDEDGSYYIVEDYVEGKTLKELIALKGYLKMETIYEIADKLCDIMIYLHSFKPPIIYRDLKPSNIMITPKGEVKLIDFGIARIYKPENSQDTVFIGSAGFIAPEQFNGSQSNILTDVYCVGATLKALSDGIEGKNENLEKIINKAMEIDSKKRYQSVKELKKDLILEKTTIMPGIKNKKYFSLKKFLAIACVIVSIVCIIVAISLSTTKDKKVIKPQVENKVVEPKKEEVKPIVKDYSVDGLLDKNKSISFNSVEALQDEKNKIRFFDYIYEVNPIAKADIFDDSIVFSINYVEYKIGQIVLYCQVQNNSEKQITIGDKENFTIYDDSGVGIEGNVKGSDGSLNVDAGQSDNKIIITFNKVDSKSKKYTLKTNITIGDEGDSRYIEPKINIKN